MSHYKPYPAYRDSGVDWIGQVPEHWKTMSLKRVATICNGQDYKDVSDPDGAYPVMGSGGEFARASSFVFDGESVLLGRKGTIDKPLYINGPFWAVDTMFYTKIAEHAFPKFVYYAALNIPFGLYSTNTALPSMTGEDLSSHQICAPDFNEQCALAQALDRETARIDALIAKKTRFIELLKEKRQALITHAVTKGVNPNVKMKDSGVEWIGEVPEHWQIRPIKSLASSPTALFIDGDWIESKNLSEIGIRYITTGNVGEGVYKEQGSGYISESTFCQLNCTEVLPGDILISRLNPPIGRACIVPDLGSRIVTSVDNVIFRPDEDFDSRFVVYRFSAKDYFHEMTLMGSGATMQRVSRSELGNVRVAWPPLGEQIEIAKYLQLETKQIDALAERVSYSIDLLKERRSAFITAAVTGKIDLRESP